MFRLAIPLSIIGFAYGCSNHTSHAEPTVTFKQQWYSGAAEITSYNLEQARYGELREGTAITVFVTEPFSKAKQVKLDEGSDPDKIDVLKLNLTKKFQTGVYPYSMMTSVFTPIDAQKRNNTLKVTTSSQEWCGHAFTQLNLKDEGYRWQQHSYFESEGEQDKDLQTQWVEDEIWNLIRINPKLLPEGTIKMLPSTMNLMLTHHPAKAVEAKCETEVDGDMINYHIVYPTIQREITFHFKAVFPHEIMSWEETYVSGFGSSAKALTTRATLNKRIMLDYWNKNHNADASYRAKLGLE